MHCIEAVKLETLFEVCMVPILLILRRSGHELVVWGYELVVWDQVFRPTLASIAFKEAIQTRCLLVL